MAGSSLIVAVLGLSALTLQRVHRRGFESDADLVRARINSEAAIQLGLLRIKSDPNWRQNLTSGVWEANRTGVDGTYNLEGIDPVDGDLADSAGDPVVLVGTGFRGRARQKVRVELEPPIEPLPAIRMCLHAQGGIQVLSGKAITVSGAPLSSNSTITNAGTIHGDVECTAVTGTVTGSTTLLAPPKAAPDAAVFDMYKNMATVIPFPGNIDKRVLTPTLNPWNTGTNPNGVYFIDAGSSDLIIQGSRIHGTLVVQCQAGNKVIVDNAVFMHSARADYPVLIVSGALELSYKSNESDLTEGSWTTNFNPASAPYQGVTDGDTGDVYPNEIQGLVHVTGALTLKQTARVRGAIVCESTVRCEENNQVVYTPSLASNPPLGYSKFGGMTVMPGSWQRVVD